MKKSIIILAGIAVAAVSCTKEPLNEEPTNESQIAKKVITVNVETPRTKTVFNTDRTELNWTNGDNFRLMTNTSTIGHDATTLNYVAGGKFEPTVSADATEVYAYYFAGSYTDDNHSNPTSYTAYINKDQTQTQAGVLNGQMIPMAAKGTINKDNTVSLDFHQMAGVLALNIYSTKKVEGEVVKSVKVTPSENTEFVGAQYSTDLTADNVVFNSGNGSYSYAKVVLDNSYNYGTAKPSSELEKRMYEGQIYVVLARQNYATLDFEIETNNGTYTITGTSFDLTNADFLPVNINLAKATFNAPVDYVKLPWNYAGGTLSDLNNVLGVSTNGLGSDYAASHAPYQVKFDNDSDYIQVKTDKAIETVSVGYKMIGGGNTSHLYIYQSTDGSSWGEKIDDLIISGNANSTGTVTTSAAFNVASRYVKIEFKKGSNVGIGPISIETPDPAIPLLSTDVSTLDWAWDATSAKTINVITNASAPNTFTVTPASMDWATVSTVGNVVTVTPKATNPSGIDNSGTITIHHDAGTISDVVVTCTQTKAPAHEISIKTNPSRIDLSGTKDTPTEITVVSNYAWTATYTGNGYSVSPDSGSAGETVVTLTPSADGGATETKLGDITFTDALDAETKVTKDIYQAAKVVLYKTFTATGIGSGYGAHTGVSSDGLSWTVTFGQTTYIGTNSSNKSNCKLGDTYVKVGTPCGYTSNTTQVAAIISEDTLADIRQVIVDSDTDSNNPTKISLVYSTDNESYNLIETQDYSKANGNTFSFTKKGTGYYAVVLYYSGSSGYMRTNGLKIKFYK